MQSWWLFFVYVRDLVDRRASGKLLYFGVCTYLVEGGGKGLVCMVWG